MELGAVDHERHFLNLLHSRCLFFQQSGSNTARPSLTINRQSLRAAMLPFFEKECVVMTDAFETIKVASRIDAGV